MSATSCALTTAEQARLGELEQVVERGLQTFAEVGAALAEIRDSRLYRDDWSTFENYCQGAWGFTDRRARHLMDAAAVGTVVPVENERQARELAPLNGDEEAILAAWRDAQTAAAEHGTRITAKVVKNAVQGRVRRLEREATAEAARAEQWTCDDCGATGSTTSTDGVVGYSYRSDPERGMVCLCPDCGRRRHEKRRDERDEWWQSLSDAERADRERAQADRDAARKLTGSLLALRNPDGEGGICEFLRSEIDALQATVEASRHPDLLAELATFAEELEEVAGEYRDYVDDQRRGANGRAPELPKIETKRQRDIANKAKLRAEKAVGTCNAIAGGLHAIREDAMAVSSAEEVNGWGEAFRDASSALIRMRTRIRNAP